MDSTLGSGDRVCGFKSWPRQSGFFLLAFFLFLHSSSSFFFYSHHVHSCSLWLMAIILDHKVTCYVREESWKNPYLLKACNNFKLCSRHRYLNLRSNPSLPGPGSLGKLRLSAYKVGSVELRLLTLRNKIWPKFFKPCRASSFYLSLVCRPLIEILKKITSFCWF